MLNETRKGVPASLMCDFYKLSHREQYPDKTEFVYATWTPRSNKHMPFAEKAVWFGMQRFVLEFLIDYFNDNFFNLPLDEVIEEYVRYVSNTLSVANPDYSHLAELHELGYLPLEIKSLPEGSRVPMRVACATIRNTDARFFWLTNYIETLMSSELWKPATIATIAAEYKKILTKWARKTAPDMLDFVMFQGHDFSMRGQAGFYDSYTSNAGHLLSFFGTDTIPAIIALEDYYGADVEKEMVGTSIPATEHSVMCAGGKDNEFETYKRLITEVYPAGMVSIVSDTWDLWKCMSDIIAPLKDEIMARDGKIVIRPDSGDPANILCGQIDIVDLSTITYLKDQNDCSKYLLDEIRDRVSDNTPHGEMGTDKEYMFFRWDGKTWVAHYTFEWNRYDKQYYFLEDVYCTAVERWDPKPADIGLVEMLWDIFGGTVNEQGYKVLDSHIGTIYGDSITLDRCENICKRLEAKGFASVNVVFGIGSYTYQMITRDSLGWAMKSTAVDIDGVETSIFKDPATDDGTKKSAKGAVAVQKAGNSFVMIDGLLMDHYENDELKTVFYNGKLSKFQSLESIREILG